MHRNNKPNLLKVETSLLVRKVYAWGMTTHHDLPGLESIIRLPPGLLSIEPLFHPHHSVWNNWKCKTHPPSSITSTASLEGLFSFSLWELWTPCTWVRAAQGSHEQWSLMMVGNSLEKRSPLTECLKNLGANSGDCDSILVYGFSFVPLFSSSLMLRPKTFKLFLTLFLLPSTCNSLVKTAGSPHKVFQTLPTCFHFATVTLAQVTSI